MIIIKARLVKDGVILNDTILLPDNNHSYLRKLYNIYLSEGNTPDPLVD